MLNVIDAKDYEQSAPQKFLPEELKKEESIKYTEQRAPTEAETYEVDKLTNQQKLIQHFKKEEAREQRSAAEQAKYVKYGTSVSDEEAYTVDRAVNSFAQKEVALALKKRKNQDN